MCRQPDDRNWEEEFIHNQNIEIEALKEELYVLTQFRDRVCHLQAVNFGNATKTHLKLHTLVNEITQK